MLTWEDDVEVHALRKRGWSISAIARHTGRDRKTVRAYLNGERTPGVRKRRERGPVRTVRRVRHLPAVRGPASVGSHPVRRARRARLSAVVSDADPADPRPQTAPGVRGLRDRHRPGERDHRPSARRGNSVGLGRSAESTRLLGLGRDGAPAGRLPGAFGALARDPGTGDDPTAPRRRPRPGQPPARRRDEGVAVRSDGHRLPSRVGPGDRELRRRREALRRLGGDLPTQGREPQGGGGEGQSHCRPTMVAHPARRRHRRTGAATPGRVLPAARRHPDAGHRRRQGLGGDRRRRRTVAPRCRPRRIRRSSPNPGPHRGRRWCPTAATGTRCPRSWRRRRSPSPRSSGPR